MRARRAAAARVLANASLRRIELAFAAFVAAEEGVWTAVLVYAYERSGTAAAGFVAVAQLVPAALVAPFTAAVADRRGGAFALTLGYSLQAAALTAIAALALSGAPAGLVYGAAVVAAAAFTFTRPAQTRLQADLVQEPDELTAAVIVSGWVTSGSVLVGPALAGVLIALDGPGLVAAAFALPLVCASVLLAPLAVAKAGARAGGADAATPAVAQPTRGRRSESLATLRTIQESSLPIPLLAVIAGPDIAVGAVYLLAVVLAVGVLGLGPSGAGYLTAAFGAGAVIGAIAAIGLIGLRGLARAILAAAAACAAAYALLAAISTTAAAVALLMAAGAGQTLLDLGGRTLLARVASIAVFARAFGILESLSAIGLAVGSLLVPALVALGGVRLALLGVAAALGAAVVASLRGVLALDCRPNGEQLSLLRRQSLFAALAPPELEALACALRPIAVRAGETVLHEGDTGHHLYLVADGSFAVTVAGEPEPVRIALPGENFGEIALLRDVPRTATVRALGEGRLYALAREPFLMALAGAKPSDELAEE